MISSYPTVFALGHKMIEGIFDDDDVIIEEKIDGSQFSFGIVDGELMCRSKGKQIILDAPEKMFSKAIETAQQLAPQLVAGHIYRCEYLQKPKHNVLAYDRVPAKNLILFDIMTGLETYATPKEKKIVAEYLGLDCVPVLFSGKVTGMDMLSGFLEKISILGGSKIEGIVVKNYSLFTQEKKIAIGKYVSEAFKEVANVEWKRENPTQNDVVTNLILKYKTPARWNKAIQHLTERGEITNSPKDIGPLIKEIQVDTEKECADEIKDILFKHFWPHINRGIIAGFPEEYKKKLAESAFGDKP